MADVAHELLTQFLAHPDRDLLGLVSLVASVFSIWVYRNVYWTPEHLGKWTRRAQGKFDFDDAAVKALCSVAPFIADVLLSPLAVLKGLNVRPSLAEKVEEMDRGISEYIFGRAESAQKQASLLGELRDELTNLALAQNSLEEIARITHPLRMNELETEMARLENSLREASTKMTELEEAYITCLDDSIEAVIDRRLADTPAATLENADDDGTGLYETMLGLDDKKGGCFV